MPKAKTPFTPRCLFTSQPPQALLNRAYEIILRYAVEAKDKGA